MRSLILRIRSRGSDWLTDKRILPYVAGANEFRDIRRRLSGLTMTTIFDVGANVGETAVEFRYQYPTADVHCFEPNKDLVPLIKSRDRKLKVYQLALGSTIGRGGLDRSLKAPNPFSITNDLSGETVDISTIDDFCASNKIPRINYLKVDTEGYDLEVLRGATQMLSIQAIDIAQAEVSMNPENLLHVPFWEVTKFMESHGYRLFGIYEQMHEWISRMPNLRRANVMYISPRLTARQILRSKRN